PAAEAAKKANYTQPTTKQSTQKPKNPTTKTTTDCFTTIFNSTQTLSRLKSLKHSLKVEHLCRNHYILYTTDYCV
ncbi:hypothetical protein, partial [Neisseria dentiae]|uniref:hypothetical protein n=1 Tax=Neisseria dentiae TaxID=194197 RepID=UPI001B80BD97